VTWVKTRADRERDKAAYGSPAYRRNRPLAMARDRWRCQLRLDGCAGAAAQCDHVVPVADGGGDDLANLRAVCVPCHRRHTARQGGGFRAGQGADPEPRPRTNW
jgi:5-methylcytosine-specific restriction protein A